MSYATRSDMVRLYTEAVLAALTDPSGDGAVDEAALTRTLVEASAEIDTYLAGRYALPMATVPEVLVNKACVIARYLLDGQNGDDIVRNRYRDAIAWLKDVGAGKASLGLDGSHAAQTVAGGADIRSVGRVFGREGRV